MLNLRKHYFNIDNSFELSSEEFDKQWALVNNFWTRFNGYKQKNRRCPSRKARITSKRSFIECKAKIKITWFAATNIVHVERIDSTPDHCHTIDEVD
ncbi:15713_t:CDS:2, partial [Cetraspora pellucida]